MPKQRRRVRWAAMRVVPDTPSRHLAERLIVTRVGFPELSLGFWIDLALIIGEPIGLILVIFIVFVETCLCGLSCCQD